MLAQQSGAATNIPWFWWAGFIVGIVALLLVDLLVFHREAHRVGTREAAIWSGIWIGLGLAFSGVVFFFLGVEEMTNYLTGYLIEKSLSVDNLFVFVVIFNYFQVPPRYQHRVLFYGILGAFVFRGLFIAAGAALLRTFGWVAYVFGAFLIFTGYRLGRHRGVEVDPEHNPVLNFARRHFALTEGLREQKLFVREEGQLRATPLFLVLLVIETTDIIFAVDSIPAIFAVTDNAFIVFSSNAFALLGLRALYFLLADLVARFRYLDVGLAIVLALVGVKMIVEQAGVVHIPAWAPLIFVTVVIGVAVIASIRNPLPAEEVEESVPGRPGDEGQKQAGAGGGGGSDSGGEAGR